MLRVRVSSFSVGAVYRLTLYQLQKNNPIKLCAIISAIARNVSAKFYTFMRLFYLQLTAKWYVTNFKYDEAIDF